MNTAAPPLPFKTPDIPTRLTGILLGLSLMFMVQGYFGIDHDSVLYLGEVMRLRLPDILGQDLFFAHGSQGSYTLLPHLIAPLSGWIDVSSLFLWGTVVGMMFFACASWVALSALLPAQQRFVPWLALLCLPTVYGAFRIFGYAEAFFTPRLYAEPLCLLALALLTLERLRLAAACLLLAALLHPLQAIGAGLVMWVWLVLKDRRWLHTLWLAIIPAGMAATGIAPFRDLLHPLDPATSALAHTYSRHLFVGDWRLIDFQPIGFDLLILLHASRTLSSPFRRWSLAAVVGMLLALSASYLLADLLHSTLAIGLQLWRAHWLAHWLAMAAVGILLQRDLQARDWQCLLLLALTFILAYGRPDWYWIPLGLLYVAWPRLSAQLRPAPRQLVAIGCGLAILLFLYDYTANAYAAFVKAHRLLQLVPFDRTLFTFPVFSLGLALLATALWVRAGKPGRVALLALLVPFSAYAGLRWDNRPALYEALESHPFRPDLFGMVIPVHAQVFWERASSVANWLVLNRADYYSPQQLSGLIFSPGAAADAEQRILRLNPLRKDSQKCMAPDLPAQARMACHISSSAMQTACAPSHGGPPAPDYLILPYRQPQPAIGQWTVRLDSPDEPVRTYWLYACQSIRDGLPPATPSPPAIRPPEPRH